MSDKQRTNREMVKLGKQILKVMQNHLRGWEKPIAEKAGLDPTAVYHTINQLMKIGIGTTEAVLTKNKVWKLEDFK